MKFNDIIGFAATLSAGAFAGYQFSQEGTLAWTDYLIILVLIGIGFYFAVILS